MASVAEELDDALGVLEDGLDPADLEDDLGDATTAGKRKKRGRKRTAEDASQEPPVAAGQKGRLRLRAGIPELPKYAGKKVSRGEVFDANEVEAAAADDMDDIQDRALAEAGLGDDDGDDLEEVGGVSDFTATGVGNFNISSSLEKEYQKLMKKSDQHLQLMRTPSASDVAKRQVEADQLKHQLAFWRGLVEFRIHMEEALNVAHRLPVATARTAFCEASEAVSAELEAAAIESADVLGNLLNLQRQTSAQWGVELPDPPVEAASKRRRFNETEAWQAVDTQMEAVLDWSLQVADKWKEQTRLDARRGFKVLDQPLHQQMRSVADMDPMKFRARSVPPAGKHKVVGLNEEVEAATEGTSSGSTSAPELDIFDDREFYVQLLREVLSAGGSPGSSLDGDQAKALRAELQGRRANRKKAKAEVDRRASKGRKIRYVPIEKLQNFMAPRKRTGGTDGQSMFNDTFLATEERANDVAVEAMLKSLFAHAATSA